MTIEYDGSRYVGWQRQKNGLSVQEVLESALEKHLKHPVRVNAAGRTDAGVHALGQVVSFKTPSTLKPRAIQHGALAHLPRDVTIVAAQDAPPHFDARRSARLRWYRFFISNRDVAPAVASKFLTYVPYRLDFTRMEHVADLVAGDHDFRAFRAISCSAVRTQLTLHRPVITRLPDSIIMFDFRCQSFLQNMIRIMAGVMVACARGKMRIEQVKDMLETGVRINEATTLPPNGLFLYRVLYEGDTLLPRHD